MPLPLFDYFQYMVKIKNFRGNVKTEGIGPDGGIFGGHWNSPDHSKYFHIDIPCASVGKMCVHTFELKKGDLQQTWNLSRVSQIWLV